MRENKKDRKTKKKGRKTKKKIKNFTFSFLDFGKN